jgi:hypothetical protein
VTHDCCSTPDARVTIVTWRGLLPRRQALGRLRRRGGQLLSVAIPGLNELTRTPYLERALALHFVALVVAVLRLDPAALTGDVAARPPLGDDALQLVLADRLTHSRTRVRQGPEPRRFRRGRSRTGHPAQRV